MPNLAIAVQRIARVVHRYRLLIVALMSPVFLFPTPARAPALLAVPCLWLATRLSGREPLPQTPLDGAFFLLVSMVTVSLFATPDIVFSMSKVAGLLFGIVCYYLVVGYLTNERKLWLAVHLFLISGAGLCVVALVGTRWAHKVPILGAVVGYLPTVIRGLHGAEEGFHPNAVAGVLILFVPLQLTFLVGLFRSGIDQSVSQSPGKIRLPAIMLHAALLCLTGGTLLLTQSRGAWLGLCVALTALLIWQGKHARRLLMFIVLLFISAIIVIGPQKLGGFAASQLGRGMQSNVSGRIEIWARAVQGIEDFPITGMGMNMFRRIMPLLYPNYFLPHFYEIPHAHNHLLQAALDLGLPGLVAYLSLWLGTAYLLACAYQKAATPWMRTVASGLAAGLIAHFVFGISDAIALGAKVGIFFWLSLAIGVSLFQLVYSRNPSISRPVERLESCD